MSAMVRAFSWDKIVAYNLARKCKRPAYQADGPLRRVLISFNCVTPLVVGLLLVMHRNG